MIKLIRNFWSDSKITSLHVNYENQKKKVKLATQLFSQSVANAIEYCDAHLSLPQFKNSAATTIFFKLIDNTFDILNSRNMNAIGFKKGLKEDNFLDIIEYLQKSKNKHMFDTDVENNHILILISSNYSKIRIHHLVNLETKSSHGINIRQKLTKIILFKHQ